MEAEWDATADAEADLKWGRGVEWRGVEGRREVGRGEEEPDEFSVMLKAQHEAAPHLPENHRCKNCWENGPLGRVGPTGDKLI